MTAATTSTFGQFVISVGDGESPEVFTKLCGLTSKGFGITNQTSTTAVPDCDNEDLPAFEEEAIVSQNMPISGSGVFAREMQALLLKWAADGSAKNIRVYPGSSSATGDVQYYQGAAICKEVTLTGERGNRVQANLAFAFTAKPSVTLVS